jgi:hypothetical protein
VQSGLSALLLRCGPLAAMVNSGLVQFMGNGFWQHKLAQILVPVSLSASQKLLGGN